MLALLLMPSACSIARSWAGVTLCSFEMMLLMGLPGMIRGRKKFSERAAHRVSRKNPARRMMNLIVLGASSLVLRPAGSAGRGDGGAEGAGLAPPSPRLVALLRRYDAGLMLSSTQPQS